MLPHRAACRLKSGTERAASASTSLAAPRTSPSSRNTLSRSSEPGRRHLRASSFFSRTSRSCVRHANNHGDRRNARSLADVNKFRRYAYILSQTETLRASETQSNEDSSDLRYDIHHVSTHLYTRPLDDRTLNTYFTHTTSISAQTRRRRESVVSVLPGIFSDPLLSS